MDNARNEFATNLAGFETDSDLAAGLSNRLRFFWLRCQLVSEGVWPRIGILLGALCLIKSLLLISFRKHLFEIHWRYGSQPYSWRNEVAFHLFAALVGLHVLVLGRQCAAAGKRVVRAANACVLVLAAAFLLLTFHAGQLNYLALVMNDVLRWRDLGWYFAMDFCFQPPYLMVWVLGYALLYYLLARSGREHLVPWVTAFCAIAYVALYLGALTQYYDALLIVDSVGIACLIFARRRGSPLGLLWILVLVAGSLAFFFLFQGLEPRVTWATLNPEFVVLGLGCVGLAGGVSWIAWRRQFWRGWSWMFPFVWLSFVLFINVNYPAAKNYLNLLCTSFTLPHYFLGEFAVAGLLLALALAYRRVRSSGSLWWLDVASLGLIALAIADLRLSQIMGERLDWQVLNLAWGETPRMIWRMTQPYLPVLLAALLLMSGIYALVYHLIRRRTQAGRSGAGSSLCSGTSGFLLAFVLVGVVGAWRMEGDKAEGQTSWLLASTSPLWQRATDPAMDAKSFRDRARQLGMTELLKPAVTPARPARDLNVVLIFQESTYNQFLSLFSGTNDTEPMLSRYRDRMELFPNFFSSFMGSINARFATFTGLYPVGEYQRFTTQHVPVKSVFEVLQQHGYRCSLFYSSFFDYTGFRDFLRNRGIDELYDADTMPGKRTTKPVSWGLREDEALGAIQDEIKAAAARGGKFFLTYIPAAPHNPFDGTPERFCRYPKGALNDFTPLYMNELLYMDWIVSSVVDQLRDSGLLDRTLVVITGDHGEMLGAQGGPVGHGWAVTPELANVPLIIMDPDRRRYQVNPTIGSQVDLFPTVLDLLGLAMPSGQLCQGTSLYDRSKDGSRTIILNSLRQFGILRDREFFSGDRGRSDGRVVRAYAISNQGAGSSFAPVPMTNAPAISIADFDRFQGNLLSHYAEYCRMFGGQ